MYTLHSVISLTLDAETFCVDPILTFCEGLNNIRLNFTYIWLGIVNDRNRTT